MLMLRVPVQMQTISQTDACPTVTDLMAYLRGRPQIAAVARSDNFSLVWCNERFARAFGSSPEALVRSTFHDVASGPVVDERRTIMNRALETGKPLAYIQLWNGVRSLTHVYPMQADDTLGHRGFFVMIEPLVLPATDAREFDHLPHARIPHLGELALLSRRQLEVLRLGAEGLTVEEMARELHRSDKTIDNHLRELYRQLRIHNRAQLTRFAAEHGILAFTREQWFALVAAADLHPANRARNPHLNDDPA
jgi:DNA-binding CsgD family transcriptional regulator